MQRQFMFILLLILAVLLMGCQGTMKRGSLEPSGSPSIALAHGYGLLYSTIDDESKVDQVLVLKNPEPPVAELLKSIGEFARNAKTQLEAFATQDASIFLDDSGLPEVEVRTRASISAATSRQIIFSGGKTFELQILLTQHQALNYISHLAGTLSAQDTIETRKQYFTQLAKEASDLHDRVIAQLATPHLDPPN